MDERERISILEGMARFVETDRQAGIPIELVLRESARVATTIVEVADELNADVITMGTEGRSGVRRLLLGSVTEGVLRQSRRPVLTVTPRLPVAVPPALHALDRIVCAVDWSPNGRAALRHAAALAEAASASLTVAHIVHLPLELVTPGTTLSDQRLAKFREAHRRLDTLIGAESLHGTVDKILLAGSPAVEINRLALEQQASLVVVGAHGRGVMDAMLRGTTTEQVVRQAPCPVLTVRA
jgi:nucleotide-binding universal stress UspA family protein